MFHRQSLLAIVVAVCLVGATVGGAAAVQDDGSATSPVGRCDDPEEVPQLFDVMAVIDMYHQKRHGVDFEFVLHALEGFNRGDVPESTTRSDDVSVLLRNERNSTATVTVTLRCLEREGNPVVYRQRLRVPVAEDQYSSVDLDVPTGNEDGTYRLVVTAADGSASRQVEPELFMYAPDGTPVPSLIRISNPSVGVTVGDDVTMVTCTDIVPCP